MCTQTHVISLRSSFMALIGCGLTVYLVLLDV